MDYNDVIREFDRFRYYLPFSSLNSKIDLCELMNFVESLIESREEDNLILASSIMKNYKY